MIRIHFGGYRIRLIGLLFFKLFICHPDAGGIFVSFTMFGIMQSEEGFHTYYIYILTNKAKTVYYTGVTNHLKIRLEQHKEGINPNSFTSKYNVYYLLYYEKFTWIQEAIAREKEIKGWRREKKINLIKTINPDLEFLNNLFE